MKKRLSLVALVLVLALAVPTFGVASETEKSWQKDTSPIDMEIFVNYSWYGMNWEDPAAKRVTEETGVTLKISRPVTDDNQKLTLMINGGEIPDYVVMDKNNLLYGTLIRSGLVSDLEAINELYAPDLKENCDDEIFTNYLWDDGKTYAITTHVEGKEYIEKALEYNALVSSNQGIWTIRQDYYDEIGRPDVTTPDGLIAALEQIKANHPEKIAFYAGDAGFSTSLRTSLSVTGTQFGIPSYVVTEEGNIKSQIYSPQFKEAVMFLHKLAAKDLLTRDSFIDTKEVCDTKCSNGDVVLYSWTIGDGQKIPADNPETAYEILPPFETYKQYRTGTGWNATFVSNKSEGIERRATFLSYLASIDGHAALFYGTKAEEGETYSGDVVNGPHYYIDETGKPTTFLDYYADKQKDWDGVEKANGLSAYWFAASSLLSNQNYWNKADEFYAYYNELYGEKIEYRPEFDKLDPDSNTDEGAIVSKLRTLFETSSVKIIFAADEATALSEFDTFIAKSEEVGLPQLEAVWTENYQKNLAKMGL